MFFCLLGLHLAAIINHIPWLGWATKPLLVPVLVFWLLQSTSGVTNPLKIHALSALLFSWAGDVLLIFVPISASFFLAGLTAFLIAQLFYLYCFLQLRKAQQLPFRFWLLIPVGIFCTAVLYLLTPWLGALKIPVMVYGTIISLMLFAALQLGFSPRRNRLIAGGAALFVFSDIMLAWNKFRAPVSGADVLIMLSYGIAQYYLCRGIIGNLNDLEVRNKPLNKTTN